MALFPIKIFRILVGSSFSRANYFLSFDFPYGMVYLADRKNDNFLEERRTRATKHINAINAIYLFHSRQEGIGKKPFRKQESISRYERLFED